MAARTPRRVFATPFVVTLAAAPACYVQSTPPPQQPAPQQPAPQVDPTMPPRENPPRPQPEPTAAVTTPNAKWRIFKDGGSCYSQPKLECPPNVACNPPRPTPYTCPAQPDLANGPQTIVSSADGMSCQVDWGPMDCPKGAMCNPPPPMQVACPKP